MIMDWREFINHLLNQDLKLSPKEVEAETGIRQPIINRWMIKGLEKKAHRYTIRRLETGLKIKIDDSDPQNITYQKLSDENKNKPTLENSFKNLTYNSFPVVTIVRAGQPNGVREDEVLYYAEFNYTKREGVVAVLVEGDSMEPELKHGDIVLIDKYADPISDNIVVAVFENNEHTIKKYRVLTEDLIELLPANKNYQSLVVKKSKLSAIYKVVRSLRSH